MRVQVGELSVTGMVCPSKLKVWLTVFGVDPRGVTIVVVRLQMAFEANWFFQVMM